jgi:hypothetical protein
LASVGLKIAAQLILADGILDGLDLLLTGVWITVNRIIAFLYFFEVSGDRIHFKKVHIALSGRSYSGVEEQLYNQNNEP